MPANSDETPRLLIATNISAGNNSVFSSIYEGSQQHCKSTPAQLNWVIDGKRKTATSKRDKNKYTFKYISASDLIKQNRKINTTTG